MNPYKTASYKVLNKHALLPVTHDLLKKQDKLGLSSAQLVLILQLFEFWGRQSTFWPRVKKKDLAKRMGVGVRQIQRYVAELEDLGLVQRVPNYKVDQDGMYLESRTSNDYDLTGLFCELDCRNEFTHTESWWREW